MSKYGLNIGEAVKAMKDGELVSRSGWNGKGMYLELTPIIRFSVGGETREYAPHIAMWTAQETRIPWVASQTDLLAQDWFIFEKETLKNG